tara:strand:- start:18933 stop:20189 length:1257 start_codon:yes stop_codon:yes gene_type:complete
MVKKNKKLLALYGGEKIRTSPMPARYAIGKSEKKAVNEVINYYSKMKEDPPYDGVYQKKFENNFSKKMGNGFSLAVCSGSVACFIGVKSLNLPKNSEVIVSPVTDSGSLFAIIESGLKPVVVDSMKDSFNTSWEHIKKGITKKTSALFLVHCSGNPLEMFKIKAESKKIGLKIIEDCSQAPFARVCKKKPCIKKSCINMCKGDFVGSFGDVSVFSTMYRKSLQSGGSGGIVYTKNKKTYHNIIEMSDRGRPKWDKNHDPKNIGKVKYVALNYNTDELSSAIGISSLKRIDKLIQDRMKFMHLLSKKLKKLDSFVKCAYYHEGTSPFLFPIIVNENLIEKKELIAKAILAEGINLSIRYDCVISEWEISKDFKVKTIADDNVKKMKSQSFNLFLNENYTAVEVDDIYKAFEKVSKHFIK